MVIICPCFYFNRDKWTQEKERERESLQIEERERERLQIEIPDILCL